MYSILLFIMETALDILTASFIAASLIAPQHSSLIAHRAASSFTLFDAF